MDFQKDWNKALKNTEIIRTRVKSLMTFSDTTVQYILLSESSINIGDTIVRKGSVVLERPTLILPPNIPQFSGFEFDDASAENAFVNFLLVRGIQLPSIQYNNHTQSLDIYEGKLSKAISEYNDLMQKQENVVTGLIAGPEDCWQFSLLIYLCSQVTRNAEIDFKKLLDEYNKRNK